MLKLELLYEDLNKELGLIIKGAPIWRSTQGGRGGRGVGEVEGMEGAIYPAAGYAFCQIEKKKKVLLFFLFGRLCLKLSAGVRVDGRGLPPLGRARYRIVYE